MCVSVGGGWVDGGVCVREPVGGGGGAYVPAGTSVCVCACVRACVRAGTEIPESRQDQKDGGRAGRLS